MISESSAIEPAPLSALGTSSLQSPVGITDVTTNYDQVSETNPIRNLQPYSKMRTT